MAMKLTCKILLTAMLMMAYPVTTKASADKNATEGSSSEVTSIREDNIGSQPDKLADEAYMRGSEADFNEAIRLYHQAMDRDGTSAAIYYNLGNAYYRIDSLAKAIICYERALRLDPTDKDIQANLDFVNSKIIDAQTTDGMTNILVEKSRQMFSSNGWAIVSLIIFIGVLLLAAGYIFSRNVQRRKLYFFTGLVLLGIDILSIIITFSTASVASRHDEAIVTVSSTQLSTSPSTPLDESQRAMPLHEGSKVKIIRELSTPNDPKVKKWIEVEAAGDNRAWIDAEAIEII